MDRLRGRINSDGAMRSKSKLNKSLPVRTVIIKNNLTEFSLNRFPTIRIFRAFSNVHYIAHYLGVIEISRCHRCKLFCPELYIHLLFL